MSTPHSLQGVLRLSASAGSGKTYSLTQLFIRRALTGKLAFRGMVAITFTNKAAAELKQRILQRLHTLTDAESIEKNDLEVFDFDNAHALANRAKEVLDAILHDFDSFQVSTIDSFFQTIFSQLSYELNMPAGLQPDLDRELIKREILELGMRQMDGETRHILLENLMEALLEKGTGWRQTRYLENTLLDNLFADPIVDLQLTAPAGVLSGEAIQKAKNELVTYINGQKERMQLAARHVVNTVVALGYGPKQMHPDTDKAYLDELSKIEKMAQGQNFATPSNTQCNGAFWRKPKSKSFTGEATTEIAAALIAFGEAFSLHHMANLSLAERVAKHLSSIRLLVYFRNILQQRNQEAQRYLLQEVKYVLKNMVDDEVPYIYERLGNQVHTLLIDEFQDTDAVQWKVILPLARAILDAGGFFCVVGDVKQSIYGWRGADSSLFKSGLESSLSPIPVIQNSLPENWRSEARIVDFNNWLFGKLSKQMPQFLEDSQQVVASEKWKALFENNYEDHRQALPPIRKTDPKGFVELRVRKRRKEEADSLEETENLTFGWIVDEVKRLQDQGIDASSIGILVRSNDHLNQVVQLLDGAGHRFLEYDFSYTSSAEMLQGSFPFYQFMATALACCTQPGDFELEEMSALVKTLGLDPSFGPAQPGQQPTWHVLWKSAGHVQQMKTLDLPGRFGYIVGFFGLAQPEQHRYALVQFKNLVYRYIQEDSDRYTSFAQWWEEKAASEKLVTPDRKTGIQVMTIHKSKGLDFGVVILAISSTSTGDSLHGFTFWPEATGAPWNAYPVMKADARLAFMHSDLGTQYSEKVYSQALENLNTWYVAFTRPRFGLIVDITLDIALDGDSKSPGKWARMGFVVPTLFLQYTAELSDELPGSELVETDDTMLFFRYGEVVGVAEKRVEPAKEPSPKLESIPVRIPWATPKPEETESRKVGVHLHRFLADAATTASGWRHALAQYVVVENVDENQAAALLQLCEGMFADPQIREWFSDKYQTYPEQELMDENGQVYRADRILVGSDSVFVLDFKSGTASPAHEQQVQVYTRIVEAVFRKPAMAVLIYLNPFEIKKL